MANRNKNKHIEDYHRDLLHHLRGSGGDVELSEKFSALSTNAERVQFAHSLLEHHKLFPLFSEDRKSDVVATASRKEGNEMYKKREIAKAIEFYTKSVAHAEENSENLGLALANRSAALFEAGFFKECVEDITRALENNYPNNLKTKLLTRLENAKQAEHQTCNSYHQPPPKIPGEIQNEGIPCAANSVELQQTSGLGRHVVAVRDVEIGEVLAVERPFCSILTKDYFKHCHECIRLCYNLIPCDSCTQVLYCSLDCKNKAKTCHQYECGVVKTFRELHLEEMQLLPIKIALSTRDLYRSISQGFESHEGGLYQSDSYRQIHNLVGNTAERSASDLFKRAVFAAIVFHLIKLHSSFFRYEDDENMFKELVLLHMQTAPCNFHEISEISGNENVYEPRKIGAGAYSFLSMFNHSCSPNVCRQCFGTAIALRAIKSIKKGEQCYDNYGYHHAVMEKPERKSSLARQYFFECRCEACENDWPLHADLPEIQSDVGISSSDFDKLMAGDVECAQDVLEELLPKLKELEVVMPNKKFAENQEIIKQCFSLLGNIRKTI